MVRMKMTAIDVSVIIVCNDHKQYLRECVSSLLAQNGDITKEIIIVDNSSADGSAEYIRNHFTQVCLFAEKIKRGFAANNNLGIRASQGRYVFLLNPDTQTSPNALKALVCFMDEHPDIGICGPQLQFPSGEIQFSCRSFPTWKTALVRRTPLRKILRDSKINRNHLLCHLDHSNIQQVDWLLGAALFVRRDTLDDIGLLDEHFFLYVEDIDLCLRAHQRNWKVIYFPEAQIKHYHLAVSDKKFFDKMCFYHLISMIYYVFKHDVSRVWPKGSLVGGKIADLLNSSQRPRGIS